MSAGGAPDGMPEFEMPELPPPSDDERIANTAVARASSMSATEDADERDLDDAGDRAGASSLPPTRRGSVLALGVGVIVGAVLAGLGIGGWQLTVATSDAGALAVVGEYLDALEAGDAAGATAMIAPDDGAASGELLTNEAMGGEHITGAEVAGVETHGDARIVTVTYRLAGDQTTAAVRVERSGLGWRITSTLATQVRFLSPAAIDLGLTANGVAVPGATTTLGALGATDVLWLYPGSYAIAGVGVGSFEVTPMPQAVMATGSPTELLTIAPWVEAAQPVVDDVEASVDAWMDACPATGADGCEQLLGGGSEVMTSIDVFSGGAVGGVGMSVTAQITQQQELPTDGEALTVTFQTVVLEVPVEIGAGGESWTLGDPTVTALL